MSTLFEEDRIPDISVVSPVYGCPQALRELVERLTATLTQTVGEDGFEIILVDDCSPDDSWEIIKTCTGQDQRVKGLRLAHLSPEFLE